MSNTPQPDAHDRSVERILLQTVPWDARKKGGDVLQDCLRELWDKAVSIGFGYGENIAAPAKEEGFEEGKMAGIRDALEKWKGVTAAHAERREKDLEEERMWGFNVGWRLCEEENKVRSAVSVETAVPVNIVLDLEDTLPTTTCSVETQTDEPVAAAPPLDWAEDAGDLPVPMFPKSPPPAVARDFFRSSKRCFPAFLEPTTTPPAHTENTSPLSIKSKFVFLPYYIASTTNKKSRGCIYSPHAFYVLFHPAHVDSACANWKSATCR
ncbi:hypothetical protein B0H14DRAFT_3521256 [Mycena olivaceomarginata]|nr:hypothetical protein B0H14DRAFT_3521256 [Mycena olivaceomarginata]